MNRLSRTVLFAFMLFCFAASSIFSFNRKDYFVTAESYNSYKEFMRGLRFYNEERFEAAAEHFRKGLSYDPYDDLTAAWYARTLLKTGRKEEALLTLQNLEQMGGANALIESKIDRLQSIYVPPSKREALADYIYLKKFSESDTFRKQLGQPIDLLVDDNNGIYALDYINGTVRYFNLNGELIRSITRAADPHIVENVKGFRDHFKKPRAIAFDPAGNILIADTGNDIVYKMTTTGERLLTIGGTGYADGKFYNPSAVVSGNDFKIYVADTANNRVQIFSPDGEFLWAFGSLGEGEGEFFRPSGIAILDNEIYVADTGNQRIQIFDEYGVYLRVIEHPAFMHPRFLKKANDGGLFITDERRIFYYDVTDGSLGAFDKSRQFVDVPMGIAEANDGSIYVADFTSTDINVFMAKTRFYANADISLDRSFTKGFPQMVLRVNARDEKGRPLTGLTRDNFYVEEIGARVHAVDLYDTPDMHTQRYIILVDASEQAKAHERELKEEIEAFTRTLKGTDEALVIHYNDSVTVRGGYQNMNLRIIDTATKISFKGGKSALSEAIFEGVRHSMQTYKRAAIVVFSASETDETSFAFRPHETIAEYARNNFMPITTIEVGRRADNYFLNEIAKETFGRSLSSLVSIDYEKESDYLRSVDLGVYYLVYRAIPKRHSREHYRFVTVGLRYRDMSGEDEAGYLVP